MSHVSVISGWAETARHLHHLLAGRRHWCVARVLDVDAALALEDRMARHYAGGCGGDLALWPLPGYPSLRLLLAFRPKRGWTADAVAREHGLPLHDAEQLAAGRDIILVCPPGMPAGAAAAATRLLAELHAGGSVKAEAGLSAV